MAREDLVKVDGIVSESLSAGQFAVKLADGRIVTARLSGKIRRFHIQVLVGDRVTLGLSPYDLTHGLILSRERLNTSNRPGPRR